MIGSILISYLFNVVSLRRMDSILNNKPLGVVLPRSDIVLGNLEKGTEQGFSRERIRDEQSTQ